MEIVRMPWLERPAQNPFQSAHEELLQHYADTLETHQGTTLLYEQGLPHPVAGQNHRQSDQHH
jgi:hypothetical protein